jgi:hypothetical protein
MKSLKRGSRVNVYKWYQDGSIPQTDLEGSAVLQTRIRKNYAAQPPYETWMVKFDEDEEPVQRNIQIDMQEETAGMLSSLARSPDGRDLLMFMKITKLPEDWSDPIGHEVTAFVSGQVLDNSVGSAELTVTGKVNDEMLVHLQHSDTAAIVNLATILALAAGYVRQQYKLASEVVNVEGGSDEK